MQKHQPSLTSFLVLVTLCGTLISARAQAQADGTSSGGDPSTVLSNLVYYPHPGRFLLTPRYEMPIYDKTDSALAGNPTSSTTSTFEEADLTLTYGLPLNGLRISAADTALFHRHNDVVNATSGKTTTSDTAGFSDPTFSSSYRYFSTANYGWSGDIGVTGSPSLVDHRITNTTEEGNDGKGYATLGVTSSVFHRCGFNEAELSGTVTRLFSGSSVQDVGDVANVTTTRNSTWSGGFNLYDRVHLGASWFVQPEGDFSIPYSYSQTNLSTGRIQTVQLPFSVTPRLTVGLLPTKWLLLDTAVSYARSTTTTTTMTQSPSTDSTSLNTAVTWWVRARFEL